METPNKRRLTSKNCITPTVQQISYHEVIKFGNDTLHRSFSFQRMWSPVQEKVGKSITQGDITNYQVPNCSPAHTYKRKKLSLHDSTPKKLRLTREPRLNFSKLLFKMFLTITGVAALGAIAYNYFGCSHTSLFYERHYFDSVYGQDEAITKILNAIIIASSRQEIQTSLLLFIGPTGVGKTLTTSIIKKNFPSQENIHFVSANKLSAIGLENTLGRCMSLLLIEDCDCLNLDGVFDVLRNYKRKHRLLVILSVTRRSDSDWCPIDNDSGHFRKDIVVFSPLKAEDVKNCFINEIVYQRGYRSNKITSEELSQLVEQQMQVIPEAGSPPGCKLVHGRVAQFLADKSAKKD